MTSEHLDEASDAAPRRAAAAVIADYLNQFVNDEPVAYDRPDAGALIRWLHDEGWQITPLAPGRAH